MNYAHINDVFDDIDNKWFVQVTVYKTYSFKNEEIRNEYIKQGKDWIERVLKNTDLDGCEDVKSRQFVQCKDYTWSQNHRVAIPKNPKLYEQETYYIINNKAGMSNWRCLRHILTLFGLWCILDTIICFQTRSSHASFVFVKELRLEMKEDRGYQSRHKNLIMNNRMIVI